MYTHIRALSAVKTALGRHHNLRYFLKTFRIVTPVAAQRAALEKYGLPYSRSIKNCKLFYVKYQALVTHITAPMNVRPKKSKIPLLISINHIIVNAILFFPYCFVNIHIEGERKKSCQYHYAFIFFLCIIVPENAVTSYGNDRQTQHPAP